ncbi:MAG: hypothetical protein OSJ63_08295, partial [Bacilli bacterium]|nr:hypothetical protein [Bacilli bacterium]
VTLDIDFDTFVKLEKESKLAKETSKYPTVTLDYTIILNEKKYSDLKTCLDEFKSKLIKSCELLGVYENKYTIRYILGNDNRTLEQKDLQTFKERFISYIKENNFEIIE